MNITVSLGSVRGESAGIPKLVLNLQAKNISDSNLAILSLNTEIRVSQSMLDDDISKSYFLGHGVPEYLGGQFPKGTEQLWTIALALNSYTLQKIEDMRRGGDLILRILFFCAASQMQNGASLLTAPGRASVSVPGYSTLYSPFKVAQSDWEKILEQLGYRDAVRVEQEIEQARKRAQGMSQEIESILENAKKAASLVGIAVHAVHFDREALLHKKASRLWLLATVSLAAIAVAYSIISFRLSTSVPATGPEPWWSHATYLTSRLLVLSVIFFGLTWCARNYRASKHNEVVNRHRQNALRTFETFALAAKDKDTKDAVLLQATRSIFDAQSSGYLSDEPERVPSGTVIEVLRKAMSKEGST